MHEKMRLLETRGIEAFESRDLFYKWLNAPCMALGDKIPEKLIETPDGYQEVMDELIRIEYGTFS